MDVIFHLDKENRMVDLEYYTTDVRDKHNQIKPADDIISMTPDSVTWDGEIRNFLAPKPYFSIDRLYLGPSIPLFSNSWGTAFLRELLSLIKRKGSIILPVYPEGEAFAKGYWSRSTLEEAFRSREYWTGYSNLNAENDGVMSMRVGRKWPNPIPSTAQWLMRAPAGIIMREMATEQLQQTAILERFNRLVGPVWMLGTASAVCTAIIKDYIGNQRAYTVCDMDGSGLLGAEFALSRQIHAESIMIVMDESTGDSNIIDQFFEGVYGCRMSFCRQPETDAYDVVLCCGVNGEIGQRVKQAWEGLRKGGILIAWKGCGNLDESELDKILQTFNPVSFYYSYAATRIEMDKTITNYSNVIQSRMAKQQKDKCGAFRVVQK